MAFAFTKNPRIFCKCKCHCWVWRMVDSLYYSSRKISERCENSFVNYKIYYQKLCYLMRQITKDLNWPSVLGRPMNNQLVQCASLHKKCMVDWCPHWINTAYSQGLFKWKLFLPVESWLSSFNRPLCSHQWVPWTRPPRGSSKIQRHLDIKSWGNFGIGESSPNLVLNRLNLYLVKFEARWILNERALKCLIHFVYLKVNLDPEKKKQNKTKQISLVNLHPTLFSLQWILTQFFKVNWWWILT